MDVQTAYDNLAKELTDAQRKMLRAVLEAARGEQAPLDENRVRQILDERINRINQSTERDRKIDAQNQLRNKADFLKTVKPYMLGSGPWSLFWQSFNSLAKNYTDLGVDFFKQALYRALQGEAHRIAGERFFPDNDANKNLTLEEYADKLKKYKIIGLQ